MFNRFLTAALIASSLMFTSNLAYAATAVTTPTKQITRIEAEEMQQRLLYDFRIKCGDVALTDPQFLSYVATVDAPFAQEKGKVYWPLQVSAWSTLLSLALSGVALIASASFVMAVKNQSNEKTAETSLFVMNFALLGAGVAGLGGYATSTAMNTIWKPKRQFNYVEAKRLAARYNKRYPDAIPLRILRGNEF